jgi:proteasome lid subunit RPN8/RPN11
MVEESDNRIKIHPSTEATGGNPIVLADVPIPHTELKVNDIKQWTNYRCAGEKDRARSCEVLCSQRVYEIVVEHLKADTKREHGGFLFGYESSHPESKEPVVVIVDAVPATKTSGTPTRLTFTNETWRDLDEEIARRYANEPRIPEQVGWYHSHPNISIFLSHYDLDVCTTYARRKYPVALVVDPVVNRGGFFIGSAQGYDAHAPQGFWEAHDRSTEPVVTWINMKREPERPELLVAESPPGEKPEPKPISPVLVRFSAGAAVATLGAMCVLMLAAIIYLLVAQRNDHADLYEMNNRLVAVQEEIGKLTGHPFHMKSAKPITLKVTPATETLASDQTATFQIDMSQLKNIEPRWSADPAVGNITPKGGAVDYKAPRVIDQEQTIKVSAEIDDDNVTVEPARVKLLASPKVSLSIEPSDPQLKPKQTVQFHAKLAGASKDISRAAWRTASCDNDCGSISKNGLYTAPASIRSNHEVTIIATSVADPSQSARAVVMLIAPVSDSSHAAGNLAEKGAVSSGGGTASTATTKSSGQKEQGQANAAPTGTQAAQPAAHQPVADSSSDSGKSPSSPPTGGTQDKPAAAGKPSSATADPQQPKADTDHS